MLDGATAEFPVLVACGPCGNVHDLMFVLGSSFGLTALLALGQYILDRLRGRLGRRGLTPQMIEASVCRLDAVGGSSGDASKASAIAMDSHPR